MFRAILGEGFQEHFTEDDLLQEVFDVEINNDTAASPLSGVAKVKDSV